MSGYIAVVLCHAFLFIFVRWYMDSSFIRRGGDHTFTSLLILWAIAMPMFVSVTAIGAGLTDSFESPGSRLTFLGISVMLALVWALPLIIMTTETLSSGTVDSMMGLNRQVQDLADLSKAHELLRKDNREGAKVELLRQRETYPDAPSPRFMLAALAQDEKDFETTAMYYREILEHCEHEEVAWLNAAQNLSELLRDHLDGEAEANRLDAEIKRRNPDTKYKMSKTKERQALEKKYKKRKGPSRPKRDNRTSQDDLLDLNHARRLASRGEVKEAMGLINRYLNEHPGEVKIHFELVTLYERNGRADDAATRLQKLIHDYGEDNDVWGNAMMRLATIRETYDKDIEIAKSLLNTVADRLKHTKHGQDARQRLKDIRAREDAASATEG